jgi:hypothetical protein
MKKTLTVTAALMLGLLCSACSTPSNMSGTSFWGDPAPETTAGIRTIVIKPDTHYVNVTEGDVIRFVDGDKSFAWAFDGSCGYQFDLARVAPSGVLDHSVIAYVDPDPHYCGR